MRTLPRQTMVKRLLTLVFSLALVAPAFGFQPPAGLSGFEPVTGVPPSEQLPAAPLLIAAYAFVWVAVLFYVWTIWRRLNKVEKEMQALERRSRAR
jgi:CcmD family protein